MMKRVGYIGLLFICLSSYTQVVGQTERLQPPDIEYGDLQDLRGARVFVHSENLASRPHILREIARYPWLKVVGRKEDADFILLFGNVLEQNTLDLSSGLIGNGVDNSSVDMVALILINAPSPRPKVCWVSTKHRTSISTAQLLEFYPFGSNPKAQLLKFLIGSLLSSQTKLKSIPLDRPPEVKAIRDFLKALARTR
jgi:hypothetical protein